MTPQTICTIIPSRCLSKIDAHLIGTECTVKETAHGLVALLMGHPAVYEVITLDGPRLLCSTCLRPKRPPMGDWRAIERATGWKPSGAVA